MSFLTDNQHIIDAFARGEYDWFSVATREETIRALQARLEKTTALMFVGRDLANDPHLRELQLAQREAHETIRRANNSITTKPAPREEGTEQ